MSGAVDLQSIEFSHCTSFFCLVSNCAVGQDGVKYNLGYVLTSGLLTRETNISYAVKNINRDIYVHVYVFGLGMSGYLLRIVVL